MAAPALQKTWQGGTTLGGVELVNVSINEASSELTARATLLAIKQALTTFNLNPWTVVGSSDSVAASMDATDRWADISDLVYRTTGGTAFSWIVLQQGNIAANCQILLALENTLSSDPNRQDLTIQAVVGSGFTGGSITVLPTAAGMISINALTSPWLGSMTTGTKIVLSCIESDDGQCTRIIASNDTNGIPFTCLGFERPRLPNSNWVNPSCFYLLGETIASGLSCFRWETMQDTEPFLAVVKDHNNADLEVAMRMAGPMYSTVEVVEQIQSTGNPLAHAGSLVYDGHDAESDWGTLFDWYWVNRNIGGAHMLDLDTAPAGGDRTFVCVGDCVWGWLDDSATNLEYTIFNWDGTFDNIAANTTDLRAYLGVDGSVSTDIGDDSHLWLPNSGNPTDIGSAPALLNGLQFAGGTTLSADADFNGVAQVWNFPGGGNGWGTNTSPNLVPDPEDGTKSFMIGVLLRPDDFNFAGTSAIKTVISHWYSSKGYILYINRDTDQLVWGIYQTGANNSYCIPTRLMMPAEPIPILMGLDVAAGEQFLITPWEKVTVPYTDHGDFSAATRGFFFGDNFTQAGWDGFIGSAAQVFSFEWSAALNAGIGAANMENLLKYSNGILP